MSMIIARKGSMIDKECGAHSGDSKCTKGGKERPLGICSFGGEDGRDIGLPGSLS